VRRLLAEPSCLRILGDGSQSKSYIHVEDVLNAVLLAHDKTTKPFAAFNVATGDYITVTEIAQLAVDVAGLPPAKVRFEYTGGDRGWKGDVPVVRLNTDRIKSLGWSCQRTSRQALGASMQSLIDDPRTSKL
jgi:UDP-glucose 4-epimerase